MLFKSIILTLMSSAKGSTITKIFLITLGICTVIIFVYIVLGSTQKHSRDVRRISDVKTLYKALSLYQAIYGTFPISDRAPTKLSGVDVVSIALLSSVSIDDPVVDPTHPITDYVYSTTGGGSDFKLLFCLETNDIKGYDKGCNNIIEP